MTAAASSSRGPDTWQPSAYLAPNEPDNEEVLEQAAYQAAVTRPAGDTRVRKYKPRRTVDYMGGVQKWRMMPKLKAAQGVSYLPSMHPNPSDIVNLLPPIAHIRNPSTSICDYFVHTSINKERSPTRVVKWTPDSRRLLTGNDKGQFTLWNGSSFNYESITQVHDDAIRSMAFSHNGQALVSADKSGMIKYFTPQLTNIKGFQGHREACHGVAWSPNDERFVTGGDDGLVKVWSYREAREERALAGHGWDVRCVDWHPTKGLVVSGSKDMLVKFWDPRTGKELSTLHSHKAVVNAVNCNPEGHIVATAGGDGTIRLFDIRMFRELDALKGHTKEVNCASHSMPAILWPPPLFCGARFISPVAELTLGLEWHPVHHSVLASGDAAGSIAYWSLVSPDASKPTTFLEAAHDDAVFSLSFHPLGHILCSGSKDFTARFWGRARPAGGHEIDRFHLGEERAATARLNEDRPMRVWGAGGGGDEAKDEAKDAKPGLPGLSGLPGLPGLGNAPPSRHATSMDAPLPSFGGLPGLGGGGGGAARPAAPRQWGPDSGRDARRDAADARRDGPDYGSAGGGGYGQRDGAYGRQREGGYGGERRPPPPGPPRGYGGGPSGVVGAGGPSGPGQGQGGPGAYGAPPGPAGYGGHQSAGAYGAPQGQAQGQNGYPPPAQGYAAYSQQGHAQQGGYGQGGYGQQGPSGGGPGGQGGPGGPGSGGQGYGQQQQGYGGPPGHGGQGAYGQQGHRGGGGGGGGAGGYGGGGYR
ncbi:pre-mRNA cleavage and polyadenylation factor (CPF) complex subunit [Cryptotrichosporon argae]